MIIYYHFLTLDRSLIPVATKIDEENSQYQISITAAHYYLLGEVLHRVPELRVDVLYRSRGAEPNHAERRVGPAMPPLDSASLYRHHRYSFREHFERNNERNTASTSP